MKSHSTYSATATTKSSEVKWGQVRAISEGEAEGEELEREVDAEAERKSGWQRWKNRTDAALY